MAALITGPEWAKILAGLGVNKITALNWSDAFAAEVQATRFSKGEADLVDWLPQILHETDMLQRTEENLSYSAERILQVWPSRFKTLAVAGLYASNPKRLANEVYGGRMGNTQADDGWRFRGRGPIMLTGRDGYAHVGSLIGQDLTVMPGLMLQQRFGLEAAIAWWEDRIPDSMLSNQVQLRRRINGGEIGLAHCEALAHACRKAFV